MEDISELQGVIMTVRIRITVHSKEWGSSTYKYFINQIAKILISII